MTPAGLGTPRLTDVVVVGGGVMGSAAAWALARRGAGVVLLERFGPGHALGASHGRTPSPAGVLHEPSTAGWVDADAHAAVAALQAAAAAHGAVVRHHRRVEAVEPTADGGVLVRQATGGTVRARAAVVAVGAWTADVLGGASPEPVSCTYTSTPTGEFVLDRIGPVVVAAGFSGQGFEAAPAIGRVLAELALGASAGAEAFALDAHAVLR